MTDKSQNQPVEGDVKTYTVPAAEAARQLGVTVRSIYRMIERGELESNGAKHGQLLTAESLENYRTKRLFDSSETLDFDNENDSPESRVKSKAAGGPAQEANQVATMALMAIQQERDRLQSRLDEVQDAWRREVNELQEARRLEALTIGQLTERVANLEERLQAEAGRIAREAVQEPSQAGEVNIPVVEPEPPTAPEQAQKRSSWWSRWLGRRQV
jgi:hypothetical protein